MPDFIDSVLKKLADLIATNRYEQVETDTLELKPVPADAGSWRECHKTINAFLNTRGGILLLGIREVGQGQSLRYVFSGYRAEAEDKLKELSQIFTDGRGQKLNLVEAFPPPQIRSFMGGQVAIIWVDELPGDQKFVFYRSEAFRRNLTGDHRLAEAEISEQEEYRQELWQAREMIPVKNTTLADFDLDALNEYIQQLNRGVKVETIKASLEAAIPFMERKGFIKSGVATTLGMLVCGQHPEDCIGFRCHVHGYVDVSHGLAQDKQDYIGTILPLMEQSLNYVIRNIQVGISVEGGGKAVPQYPEEVLRETINNALAHRDYAIDKQAIISIKPGLHLAIRNPGGFRRHHLIEYPDDAVPLRRIIPIAKPRNPKLADVLRVYRKWEGKGIGMATLVNLCLENKLDLPTYRLYGEEVCLYLYAGKLLDDAMQFHLASYDAYIAEKLGDDPTPEQALILSYLIKSEMANLREHYTILLTHDNNHTIQIQKLMAAGLVFKHEKSTPACSIYLVDRVLMKDDFQGELGELFGESLATIDMLARRCLAEIYRRGRYHRLKPVTAKVAAFALWYAEKGNRQDIKEFDAFYRKVRYAFNKLLKGMFISKPKASDRGFTINQKFHQQSLL
jgi:ATP-dependent DNA helicase RecG